MYIYIYIYTYICTPDTPSSNIRKYTRQSTRSIRKMFHWFSTKNLVENAGKCPLLTSSKKPADIHISNIEIVSGEKVKLFGVNLKGRLNFDFHVNTLLKKPAKVPRSCKSVQLQEQISRRPS